jgi:hypothetical protein
MFAPRNTVAFVHNDHLSLTGVEAGGSDMVGVTLSVEVGCSVGVGCGFAGKGDGGDEVGVTLSGRWSVQDIPTELMMSIIKKHKKHFRKVSIDPPFFLRHDGPVNPHDFIIERNTGNSRDPP